MDGGWLLTSSVVVKDLRLKEGQGLDVQGRGQGQGVKLQGQGQGLTPALIHTWFCVCNMKNNTFQTLFFLKVIWYFAAKRKMPKLCLITFCRHRARNYVISCIYCHSHVTHKQRFALDIKDIRDNYGLAVTRMSSSIEQAIISRKLGYHVTEKECLRFTFRDRADSLAQMSLDARSRWDSHELELDQCTMASKPFVTHSLQHDGAWNFAWYYASFVVYAVLDDFRWLELPRTRTRTRTWASRTRTRTRTWKLVLEDSRGQGLSSRTTTLLTSHPCQSHPCHPPPPVSAPAWYFENTLGLPTNHL